MTITDTMPDIRTTAVTAIRPRRGTDLAAVAAERRDAYLAGLRALERLLGTHTDIPVPNNGTDYFALGADADIIREVDKIAVALGVRAAWEHGHYIAELPLGGRVAYRAIAIPAAARKRDEQAEGQAA